MSIKTETLLRRILSIDLQPLSPYSFAKTVCQPLRVPYPTEFYDQGVLWTTSSLFDQPIGLKIQSLASVDKPKLKVEGFAEGNLNRKKLNCLVAEIKWGLRIDEDLREFYQEFKDDPLLREPIKNLYGMHEFNFCSLYEMFVGTILNQNCPIERAQKMNLALLETFGQKVRFDGKQLYIFPKAETIAKVSEEQLRALKLGYRAKYIKAVSSSFKNSEIDEYELRTMGSRGALREMKKIKGVGDYCARIALRLCLRRYDEIELDVWSEKIFAKLLFGRAETPRAEVEKEIKAKWGSYAGLAARYILENSYKFGS